MPALVSAQAPTFGGCTILPSDNIWNTPIASMPVDPNSAAYIASMNATKLRLYPTFGPSPTSGLPFNFVDASTPRVPVSFSYESDPGGYPISADTTIQAGADRHAILLDTSTCILYEIFNLTATAAGWHAGSGAIFPLKLNALRPAGWTSADAAGLPILPGLIRYDEVAAGHIDHAIRTTADHTRNQYIWPARHYASRLTGSQYPPMGQRFRLKESFDISGFPPSAKVILQALKTYGLFLADNGPSWDVTGIADPRWNRADLYTLTQVTGNDFEAIDESSLMVDPDSGEARSTTEGGSSIPTGWVNIVSKNSDRCAQVTGGPPATWPTAVLEQWTCFDAEQTNQLFRFIPVTGGYAIKVKNSGLAVQVAGGTSAYKGSVLEQWAYEKQPYQIWTLTPVGGGHYTISPLSNSDFCLAVQSGSKGNYAKIQQWSCSGAESQKWRLVPPAQ